MTSVSGRIERCLFVVEDAPISPNAAGGASALYYSHLEMLAHSVRTVEVAILTETGQALRLERFKQEQPDLWKRVSGWSRAWHVIHMERIARTKAPLLHFLLALRKPAYLYENFTDSTLDHMRRLVWETKPQAIWSEHLWPTCLIQQAGSQAPVIYSHLDWHWRIKGHRVGKTVEAVKARMRLQIARRYEMSLVRRVAACVSASASELAQIQALGVPHTAYLPITYELAALRTLEPAEPARIVHLGGMNTTSSRIGLQRFLEVVWPEIAVLSGETPELWVIGSLEGAPDPLLAALRRVGAICTGYVADLGTVLRPGDIHVVPWEYDTGTRTRIPLALNYGQAVISTKAAAACLSELRNGQDCILVDSLKEMAGEIVRLLSDRERRRRLCWAGRQAFQANFTREAVQPRFEAFMESLSERGG